MKNSNPVHVVVKSPSGGAWHTIKLTVEEWERNGHDIIIHSFLNDPLPEISNIKTKAHLYNITKGRRLPKPIIVITSFIVMFLWMLRSNAKNVITIGLPISVPIFYTSIFIFWRRFNQAILADTHISGHLDHKRQQKNSWTFRVMSQITHNPLFYRYMLKNITQVICLSRAMADDLIANYNLYEKNVSVIPPFIDEEFFNYPLPKANPKNAILYVGRLSPEKNVEDLLKSFQILLKQKPDAMLTIIGDGESRKSLEDLSKNLNIHENVEFKGRQTNVSDYHAQATCQVLTSHYEGFPLALVEALANGVPVASFDGVWGGRDMIVDGKNGYIVPQYDIEALANAMASSCDKNWDRQSVRDSAKPFHPKYVSSLCMQFIKAWKI